jgi:YHS domain-containing protein
MQKDPVCGMKVDEKKTKFMSEYEGRTFYFCSSKCKDTFDKEPHKYAKR